MLAIWTNNRCAFFFFFFAIATWNFIIDALQNHLQNVIFNYIISSITEYHECPKGMFQSSFLTGLMTAHSPVFTVLTLSFPVQRMSFFYFKLFKKKKKIDFWQQPELVKEVITINFSINLQCCIKLKKKNLKKNPTMLTQVINIVLDSFVFKRLP